MASVIVTHPQASPQAVLGLALQLWFNAFGIQLSWQATVFAQLVWIVPIATLAIAIQAYGYDAAFDLGASRWQIFKDITLPLPGAVILAVGLTINARLQRQPKSEA